MKERNVTYGEALDMLRLGTNMTEGYFKEPNPYGADTDAKRYGKPGRNNDLIDGDGDDGIDPRLWGAAAATPDEVTEATEAHFDRVG